MNIEINKIKLEFNEILIPLEKIEYIIIHHTHNPELTVKTTHLLHRDKFNWAGIGYNYFIEKNAEVFEARGLYVGAHAKNYNKNSIGIRIVGNFDNTIPNDKQMNSLIDLVIYFMKKYDIEASRVIGHRELPDVQKSCPGEKFDMNEFRKLIINKLKDN